MDAKEFFGDWSEVIDFDVLDVTLNTLGQIMSTKEIGPAHTDLFKTFLCCPYNSLKVIVLAQDPYHQKGVSTGVAFANSPETLPSQYSPSLKVLYDAVEEYCTFDLPFSTLDELFPTLNNWSKQGVLLLNSALSVEIGKPGSHVQLWRPFIKSLLINLQQKKKDLVFVLMGNQAQSFKQYLLNPKNVVSCPHPASIARNGGKLPDIFSQVDKIMQENGQNLIWWV